MLEDAERHLILRILRENNGHRAKTAKALGMGLRTLGMKLKQWREESSSQHMASFPWEEPSYTKFIASRAGRRADGQLETTSTADEQDTQAEQDETRELLATAD
jgi:hypothetical protein